MFNSVTSFFTGSSSFSKEVEFDSLKCSQISEALFQARIEAATAKAILFEAYQIDQVAVGDISNLISRLSKSAQGFSESQQHQELWKELPRLVEMLSKYPVDSKLASLPSRDAARVASIATAAAGLVKERTEKRQNDLRISLDHTTRGRFKAVANVDAESKRGPRLHTLQLLNLMFDDAALNSLRRTLQNHQIVVLDLSNCFLGDHVTKGLLKNELCALSQLSVLSLRGNALTNEIVPYLISPSNNNKNNNNDDDQQQQHGRRSNNINNHNNNSRNNNNSKYPAFLESKNYFLDLRLLILDDNEISSGHLLRIKSTLATRWHRIVEKYDNSVNDLHGGGLNVSSSNFLDHHQHQQHPLPSSSSLPITNSINRPVIKNTTTQIHLRNPLPSVFLSLDGNGMAGVLQAKFMNNHPDLASHQAPECIVATSASLITACAIGLGNISLTEVASTFMRLGKEVFERSETDAQHYAESAGMWLRSWWTSGDYYNSGTALQILQDLFGNTKFVDFPCSRVIAVLEGSKGQVLYSTSPPTSPALQTQCYTFSGRPQAIVNVHCPTVAEVCLASMAGPGFFAPRALNIPPPMNTSASYSNSNTNNDAAAAAALIDVQKIAVFDASGSTPNPSHIALIESMRPTTKQRKLISIASENESQGIPENGVASIAAAALSNWPNARVPADARSGSGSAADVLYREMHGDFSTRNRAFLKLLKNHSHIARAASISVRCAVESTLENERALNECRAEEEEAKKKAAKTTATNENNNSRTRIVSKSTTTKKEEVTVSSDEAKKDNNNNDNDDDIDNDENTTNQQQLDEEMKSIQNLASQPEQIKNTANDDIDEDEAEDSFDFDKDDNAAKNNSNYNKKRRSSSFSSSLFSTAILYDRRNPCTADAPLTSYDENSMRLLSAAVKYADDSSSSENSSTSDLNRQQNNNNSHNSQDSNQYASSGVIRRS